MTDYSKKPEKYWVDKASPYIHHDKVLELLQDAQREAREDELLGVKEHHEAIPLPWEVGTGPYIEGRLTSLRNPKDDKQGELDKLETLLTHQQNQKLVFIPIQTKQTLLTLEKLEWRASMREISEISGQAITTVAYHIDQLKQLGVLKKVGPRKYSLQLSLNSEVSND